METTITSIASQMIVCVDSCSDHRVCGRIYNDFLRQMYHFEEEYEMLMQMQGVYDELGVPQNTVSLKKFNAPQVEYSWGAKFCDGVSNGAVATFYVHVLYRQNASWQGTVRWVENNQKQSFRSVLELLGLIHQAVEIK